MIAMKTNILILSLMLVLVAGCMNNQLLFDNNQKEVIKEVEPEQEPVVFFVDEQQVEVEQEDEYYFAEVEIEDEEMILWLESLEGREFTEEDAIKFEQFIEKHKDLEVVSMAIAAANDDMQKTDNEVRITRGRVIQQQTTDQSVLGIQSGGISLSDFSYSGNSVWYSSGDYSLGMSPRFDVGGMRMTSLSFSFRVRF
jgi:capsule polysaccharide export protein KpsE/RkpR